MKMRSLTAGDLVRRSERIVVECDACRGLGDLEGDMCQKCGGIGGIEIPAARAARTWAVVFSAMCAGAFFAFTATVMPEPWGLVLNFALGGLIGWNWRRILRWLN